MVTVETPSLFSPPPPAAHPDMHPGVPVCVEGAEGRALPPGVTRLDVHDPAEVVERVAVLAAARTAPG